MFGVAFNDSLCAYLSAKYPEDVEYDFPGFPCSAAYVDFVRLEYWGNDLGFLVMTNSTNAPFSVVTMKDGVLVAVPGPSAELGDYTFTATTFAAHASCDSINQVCRQDQQGITVNCTSAGYPELPYVFSLDDGFKVTNTSEVKNRIFGVVDGRMMGREVGSTEVKAVTTNPTTMATQLRWDPPEQGMNPTKGTHSPGAVDLTELAIDTYPKPTLYASCSVSYLEAVVRWDGSNGTWSLLNTTLASQQLTATLWLPVVWQFATEQLASNLMNVARTRPREEVMAVLNQQLARLAVGSAAGFFKPTAATDVSYLVQTMLGRYPVGPILALLALLLLYAILALTIFFVSLWEKDEIIVAPSDDVFGEGVRVGEPSALLLAQRWLVTPMPLVGSAFPQDDGQDAKRSVAAWAMCSAHDGREKDDRLMIGVKNEGFGVVSLRHRHVSSEES
ncbi:hypothetical protein FRC00_000912 [Tulasnella sp. 408]|nr:hypothetical protein FRC00_000912 [Tulasnella sp. 408]